MSTPVQKVVNTASVIKEMIVGLGNRDVLIFADDDAFMPSFSLIIGFCVFQDSSNNASVKSFIYDDKHLKLIISGGLNDRA